MKKEKGFALLYIVIILASIITGITLAASFAATFSGNRMRAYSDAAHVRMVAMTCAENLSMQVRNAPTLATSGTLTITGISAGSCTYTISGTSPNKTITIVATRNNMYKRITITSTQIAPTMLAGWVEKAN